VSEYLEKLLSAQRVPPEIEAAVRARRAEVEGMLRGGWSPRVYYGGSFAKKTAIAAQFDLDVVVYFAAETAAGPRELYEAVERRLRAAGHTVLRHNVALRLQYTPGWHVDVVPGRALDESYEYANLWASEREATRRTSLKKHIELARAGDREVIRLLKLWRARHVAPVGSFVLELAAARALRDCAGMPLADRFRRALELLARLEDVRLVDPANSANVVTNDIDWTRRKEVADMAARSCAETQWERVVW
jgi:hypothetical protein